MDISKLRHVAALARHRSYTRAADALGLTQSALTRSIQVLERDLQLKLFDRGRRGVVATPAGLRLAREAEDVLLRMRTLERNMSLLSRNEIGDVAFGMGPLPASIILPDLLTLAAQALVGVRIRTAQGSATDLLKLLHDDELEFVVVSRRMVQPTVHYSVVASLGWVELAVLVRPGHPLAGKRVADRDLSRFPILGGSPIGLPGMAKQSAYAPSITCDNYEALRAVTLRSDAVWIAAKCLAREEFEILRGPSIAKPNELVVVAATERSLSPIAAQLIAECRRLVSEANGKARGPGEKRKQ